MGKRHLSTLKEDISILAKQDIIILGLHLIFSRGASLWMIQCGLSLDPKFILWVGTDSVYNESNGSDGPMGKGRDDRESV